MANYGDGSSRFDGSRFDGSRFDGGWLNNNRSGQRAYSSRE